MHKGACGIQRWQTNASREIYIQLTVVGERRIYLYIHTLSHFFNPLKSLRKSRQTDLCIYILYYIIYIRKLRVVFVLYIMRTT